MANDSLRYDPLLLQAHQHQEQMEKMAHEDGLARTVPGRHHLHIHLPGHRHNHRQDSETTTPHSKTAA